MSIKFITGPYTMLCRSRGYHKQETVRIISVFIIGIIAAMLWACSPVKEVSKTSATLVQDKQDSTEYEILIVDPHFDQWYLLNYNPEKDHSNDYYRYKNLIAVSNWNDYYRTGKYNGVIDSYINYSADTDYGIELNRKLYWYFKYIRSNYGIRLF
jgi:hypothetical protein